METRQAGLPVVWVSWVDVCVNELDSLHSLVYADKDVNPFGFVTSTGIHLSRDCIKYQSVNRAIVDGVTTCL